MSMASVVGCALTLCTIGTTTAAAVVVGHDVDVTGPWNISADRVAHSRVNGAINLLPIEEDGRLQSMKSIHALS